jgi:hypothetical protein
MTVTMVMVGVMVMILVMMIVVMMMMMMVMMMTMIMMIMMMMVMLVMIMMIMMMMVMYNIHFVYRYFSKRPHVGGTLRSEELADEIEKRWREYKFDKVEQLKYNILLPYVDPDISNSVQILNSSGDVTFEFSGREKVRYFNLYS